MLPDGALQNFFRGIGLRGQAERAQCRGGQTLDQATHVILEYRARIRRFEKS